MSLDYINKLDLDYICYAMCSEFYPLPQWQWQSVKICEKLYKRFLYLLVKYRGKKSLVPTKEIDEFWHNHILYTERYMADCQALVGGYIHHHPADPEHDDLDALANAFEVTQELYLKEFGEPLQILLRDGLEEVA
ncbi:hypothetical protein Psal006b_00584 [Piscirickettsia salmonis]|uniref:Uncharacterized protein n=1 Tax=Piscirickettsia salmonis TaxID=1238 RepID=A0A1L6TE94_PISSA|nr:glycine-rich domain-containing protein-like [Piscirickettsia salmonis]AKP72715.2 hypothetical protein PSLF89_586 [Piscirickettsia salmonis LF-89 = ATCC VR-1361]ALB23784.1 hypothetical protein KU39_2608 [Piscirickettsia salmonis]ALY03633.1 hypothetical protein AWE47_12870 [Piscirickettsia salmonis]AMA43195.1 hypothetical protein AWJ11_13095 [Piscirickettsia salmonis]AOS35666.1 hypothetical protein AVM72_10215 [Piscirickettsia salmonis]